MIRSLVVNEEWTSPSPFFGEKVENYELETLFFLGLYWGRHAHEATFTNYGEFQISSD